MRDLPTNRFSIAMPTATAPLKDTLPETRCPSFERTSAPSYASSKLLSVASLSDPLYIETMIYGFRARFSLSYSLLFLFTIWGGCGTGSDLVPDARTSSIDASAPIDAGTQGVWQQLSPEVGGFVSAIDFDPDTNTSWASGDDISGLYKREASSWRLLDSAPVNWSTYSFAFDPVTSRIYAPSHFGRGMAVSDDDGVSWEVFSSLPRHKAVFDLLALANKTETVLIAALSDGLYRSLDRGESFSPIASAALPINSEFQALTLRADGVIFAGGAGGGVYRSDDLGSTWSEAIPAEVNGVDISDLAASNSALYIGYSFGFVFRTDNFQSSGLVSLNDGVFGSGLWTRLSVISGKSAAEDTLWVGTVAGGVTQHGLFVSTNGGTSFSDRSQGLLGNSVFSIAVDPTDSAHLLLASVNGPIFETMDAGQTWLDVSSGVVATDSLAFAVDSLDFEHLAFGSSTGFDPLGRAFETMDDGNSWVAFSGLERDAWGLDIRGGRLLAGSRTEGIWRSTQGADGNWTQVQTGPVGFRKFWSESDTRVFALSSEYFPEAPSQEFLAALGVYRSDDNGGSWSQVHPGLVYEAAHHSSGLAVVVGEKVVASLDGFGSPPIDLQAPLLNNEFAVSVAIDADSPTTILVGTLEGRLLKTDDCSPGQGRCTWAVVSTPLIDASLSGVAIHSSSTSTNWYISAIAADVGVTAMATNGVWVSDDGGESWTPRLEGLYPGNAVWRMERIGNSLFAGMWGSGFFKLELVP